MEHETRPLSPEEMEALTKDLQEVLEKHNAEMGVTSTITLMKREILSPLQPDGENSTESKEESDTTPKESGESSSS